jgi:glycosyltransferase involved in cell wall biosynthesis
MMALHLDEEWFCRAAWRRISATSPQPDIVHAHPLHQAARLRIGDNPVVINLPGPPNARYTGDLQQADALIADGWAAANLPAMLGRTVERLPKGVDPERFNPSGRSLRATLRLNDRRVVLTVARLVPIKNVRLLLEAVAIVRERIAGVHLVIVGDGPEAEALKHLAAVLEMSDAVTFVGSVPNADTPAFYRAADVFALSSDFDNSPNVLLEAMACGLPIVTTDVGGVRDFVAERTGGAVVPPNDALALAAALEKYLTSPAAAQSAGTYNRMRAATEFSWRTSALRLLDVYHRLLSPRSGVDRASASA